MSHDADKKTDAEGPRPIVDFSKPKLPQYAIRFAKIAMILAIVLLVFACFAIGVHLALAIVGALIAGGSAVIGSMVAFSRNQDQCLESGDRLSFLRVWISLALSSALTLVAFAMAIRGYDCGRSVMLSKLTKANLREIGRALQEFENDHNSMPASFNEIVKQYHTMPRYLISMLDPNDYAVLINGGTSFVYNPAPVRSNDPDIIVAYEPQPWSRRDVRLSQENGHAVLFADGHVSFLSPRELTAALAVDKGKRANIRN